MPILNHDLKIGCNELFDESRWPVLTMLILHANVRNRCWPGMDRLAKCTGKSTATITKAKEWLIEAGAVTLVPYKERVGTEKKLPQRQHVYQLTGQITIKGKTTNYLYIADDNGESEDGGNVLAAETLTPVDVSAAKSFSDCNQSNPDNPASVSSSATPVIGIPLTGVAVTPPENSQPDNPPAIDHPSLLQQFPTVILPPSESSGDSPPTSRAIPPSLPEPSGYIPARDLFKRWPDDGYVYRHAKTSRTVIGIEDKGDDLFEIKLNGASFGELASPEKGDVQIAYISRALDEQRQQALKELPPRNLPATGVKTHSTLPELPPVPSGALQAAKPTVKVATGLASTPPALPHVPPRTEVAVAEPPVTPKPLSPQQLLYNAVAVNFFDVKDYRHIPPELTPLIGKVRKALLKFFPDIDAAQVDSFGTWWHTTYPGIDLRSDVKLPARFGEWKTQQAQVEVKRKKNQPHPIICKCKGEGILPTTDEFGYYAVYLCPGEGEWAREVEPPPKPTLKPGQHPETCQCKGKGVTFVTDHEGRWAVPCPGPTFK